MKSFYLRTSKKGLEAISKVALPAAGFLVSAWISSNPATSARVVGSCWLVAALVFAGVKTRGFRTKPAAINFMAVGATIVLTVLCCVSIAFCHPSEVRLFNGHDLTGWMAFSDPAAGSGQKVWEVRNGVIVCRGKPMGYLRTRAQYKNYHLHLQWRWPEQPGNSGVFIHCSGSDQIWPHCYEAQLEVGNAGDLLANGNAFFHASSQVEGVFRRKLADSSERPAGEWNDYDITARDGTILLVVNGVRQNYLEHASFTSGWIALQAEGAPVEFRNVTLTRVSP